MSIKKPLFTSNSAQRLRSKYVEPISLYAAFTELWAGGALSTAPGWRGWAVRGIQGPPPLERWVATGLSANYPYCASLAVFGAGAVVLSGRQLNISRGCWTQSRLSDVSNGGGHTDREAVDFHNFVHHQSTRLIFFSPSSQSGFLQGSVQVNVWSLSFFLCWTPWDNFYLKYTLKYTNETVGQLRSQKGF